MAYQYQREVVLSQTHNVIRWLQSKADKAGSETTQVSGLDCKVAADMVAGLLAEVDRLRACSRALEAENEQKQAQIDAMRPVVEAVAEAEAEPMQLYASEEDTVYVAELAAAEGWEDEAISVRLPRDTYEQAQAFVAAHPVTTAAGEAESEWED